MGVRHVALFRWLPGKEPDLAEVERVLHEVVAGSAGAYAWVSGTSLRLSPSTFDYGLTVDFDSRDAYMSYRSDPRHLRLLSEVLAPAAETICAIQLPLSAFEEQV